MVVSVRPSPLGLPPSSYCAHLPQSVPSLSRGISASSRIITAGKTCPSRPRFSSHSSGNSGRRRLPLFPVLMRFNYRLGPRPPTSLPRPSRPFYTLSSADLPQFVLPRSVLYPRFIRSNVCNERNEIEERERE